MAEEQLENKRRIDNMISEERAKGMRLNELINDMAGVTKGMICIDLGCGPGAFSFPLALCVGNEGIVYAVDHTTEMLEYIRAKNPPNNLRLFLRDASQTGLNSEIADFCLLSLVLHDYEQPDCFIVEAFRLLKPNGKVMVVESNKIHNPPRPNHWLIDRKHIEVLLKQAGFSCFKYIEWSEGLYVATGIKKAS